MKMKRNNAKRRLASGKKIVSDLLRAMLGIALLVGVPVTLKKMIPDFEIIPICVFLVLIKVAGHMCRGLKNDVCAFMDHRHEIVLMPSIREPEKLSEMSLERYMAVNADVEACLRNAPVPIVDWHWKNDKLDEIILTCRAGQAVFPLFARVDMTERKYRERTSFPIRRVRVLSRRGVLFLENPNLWSTEDKSSYEQEMGRAIDMFVQSHCPNATWRFKDFSRKEVFIEGIDEYAGLQLTVNWDQAGNVVDIVGYDPAWQRVVSVCGRDPIKM